MNGPVEFGTYVSFVNGRTVWQVRGCHAVGDAFYVQLISTGSGVRRGAFTGQLNRVFV